MISPGIYRVQSEDKRSETAKMLRSLEDLFGINNLSIPLLQDQMVDGFHLFCLHLVVFQS